MRTIIAIIAIMMTGCVQKPPVWAKGDLPAETKMYFGNSNLARLSFIQSQVINQHGKSIEDLLLRVSELEDPNE